MTMASLGDCVTIFLLLHVLLLLSIPVTADDEKDHLLQGLNSYRQSQNVPPLSKHDKAGCLADEIADELEDRPCPTGGITTTTAMQPQLNNYPDLVKKCDIDINTTQDGVILPVCVSKRVPTLVLSNYTQSQNARYLNNSRFTGVGMGTEDDWTVLVLTTNEPGGSFASGAYFTNKLSYYVLSMFLGLFLLVVVN